MGPFSPHRPLCGEGRRGRGGPGRASLSSPRRPPPRVQQTCLSLPSHLWSQIVRFRRSHGAGSYQQNRPETSFLTRVRRYTPARPFLVAAEEGHAGLSDGWHLIGQSLMPGAQSRPMPCDVAQDRPAEASGLAGLHGHHRLAGGRCRGRGQRAFCPPRSGPACRVGSAWQSRPRCGRACPPAAPGCGPPVGVPVRSPWGRPFALAGQCRSPPL